MIALHCAREVCWAALSATACLSLLVGCSNGRGSVEETQAGNETTTFTVGGGVSGLAGSGLLLRDQRRRRPAGVCEWDVHFR